MNSILLLRFNLKSYQRACPDLFDKLPEQIGTGTLTVRFLNDQ